MSGAFRVCIAMEDLPESYIFRVPSIALEDLPESYIFRIRSSIAE